MEITFSGIFGLQVFLAFLFYSPNHLGHNSLLKSSRDGFKVRLQSVPKGVVLLRGFVSVETIFHLVLFLFYPTFPNNVKSVCVLLNVVWIGRLLLKHAYCLYAMVDGDVPHIVVKTVIPNR